MKRTPDAGMNLSSGRRLEGERLDAEELFRAHAKWVAGFLARLGARRDEMDDLLQEVFLVAHRRGGFVPGPAKPTTWLAEIAFRVLSGARRARARRPLAASDHLEDEASPARGPDGELEAVERRARVQRCLGELDDEHRAVLVLYELYGESCAAIASALEVPVGTVHSRLHYARSKFRSAWDASIARTRGTP